MYNKLTFGLSGETKYFRQNKFFYLNSFLENYLEGNNLFLPKI